MSDKPDTKPVIAKKEPAKVTVKPGTYFWCQCGHSETQPFCDGTHRKKSTLRPLKVEFDEEKTVYFCQCKQTSTPPFCDGTHKKL